jgi:AsmA-like C-terminal region
MKSTGIRLLLAALVLIFLLVAAAGLVVWAKISALKGELADNLGRALGAQVEISSVNLDFWKGELQAAGITLTNERDDAPWVKGEISQATAQFHYRDLLSPTLPLSVEVTSWRVVLRRRQAAPAETTPASETSAPESTEKRRIKVTELSAREGEVEIDLGPDQQVLMHGVDFDSGSNGGTVWTTEMKAESISDGSLQLGSSSVEIRSNPDDVTFSNLRMQCAQGAITGEADWGLNGAHETRATMKAVNIPVVMLVGVKWEMKLSGAASGDLSYQGDDQGGQSQGQISIANGKFDVLPFLGKLSALVGLGDISGMEVDKATADYAWKDGVTHLTNIDIRKTDITRISGQVDIDASGQVDGHLKVGLPDTVLTKWPQLQSAVFSDSMEDYGWADVHLTGTPDHLQEDLSARVLAVGMQNGGDLLKQGGQKAMDLWKSFMGP